MVYSEGATASDRLHEVPKVNWQAAVDGLMLSGGRISSGERDEVSC